MKPLAKTPFPRIAALCAGTLASLVLLGAARWSGFLPGSIARVFFALAAAGALAGAVSAYVARTYYSGNPALAYALSLCCAAAAFGEPLKLFSGDSLLLTLQISLETLAVLAGLLVCITACWTIDMKVNFPDPLTRPAFKRVGKREYFRSILPGTAVLAAATFAALETAHHIPGASLFLPAAAAAAFLAGALVCFAFQLPGSLWAGMGPLLALIAWGNPATAADGIRLPSLLLASCLLGQAVVKRKGHSENGSKVNHR